MSVNKSAKARSKYTMTISRLTVDKLGVKLYDKVSAVIAELVANSYDADATEVEIKAPMEQLLATKQGTQIQDKGYVIEISDNGIGMTPEEVNEFYLRVGAERRSDPRRGDLSKKFKRKVMGRKGVGKLAPFGIAQKIEILTSGGNLTEGKNEQGKSTKGYLTAHLILERNKILEDVDYDYPPSVGSLDEIVRDRTGTILRLTIFSHRFVPSIDDLARQLAQRFGSQSQNWKIKLIDSEKQSTDPNYSRDVGHFDVVKMENAEIRFDFERKPDGAVKQPNVYRAFAADGNILTDLEAGFNCDGKFYPVTGWIAYAKEPYKDDLMAGVRIYCRGKIAAQTNIFNMKAGFTGEYDIRSYLVGEIYADWLDEEEDLIQTDRRDILWSHEIGQQFEKWGQSVVLRIGKVARNPIKKKVWEIFREVSKIDDKVAKAFPSEDQKPIRENAIEFAQLIGRTMREEEAKDPERTDDIVQLSITFAPHITLDNQLRQAAESEGTPLAVITEILRTAHVAELSSFGQIAYDRVKVVERVEKLKDDPTTLEDVFQNLIEETPWLINPQWSPITANQSFATLKMEFQKYFKLKTGKDIILGRFDKTTKRMDFVLSSQDNIVQIIEIKKPSHNFEDSEMDRLNTYVEQMKNFLADEKNREFTKLFGDFHVTLVCDGEKLTGVHKTAFEGLKSTNVLTHINWPTFLLRTKRMHQDFLNESDRQKRLVAKRKQ